MDVFANGVRKLSRFVYPVTEFIHEKLKEHTKSTEQSNVSLDSPFLF